MYRDIKIDKITTVEVLRAQCDATQMRAGAILEDAVRNGAQVETEYDYGASYYGITTHYTQDNSYNTITIETARCGWSPLTGFWGIGNLSSDYIPYNIDRVYHTARKIASTAIKSAQDTAIHTLLQSMIPNLPQKIYVRSGNRFMSL